jgi:superfamily I DNA/RNA helicase
MTPSLQQLAIRDFVLSDPPRSLLIEAVAGSGKTTTGVWLAKQLPQWQKSCFLAFNRKIADELKARLPYWVTADTFHSVCLRALVLFLGSKPKIEENKCKWLLKTEVPDWQERREIEGDLLRLVSVAKSTGVGVLEGAPSLEQLASDLEVEVDLALVATILAKSNQDTKLIDFDDMLFLCLLKNVPMDKYMNLFIDEAQDTNPVQLALTQRMLFPNGRVIAVGDSRQAIYGFRGADRSAMKKLKEAFAMEELPLSVSYRCSKAVVEEAKKYVMSPKKQGKRKDPFGMTQHAPEWDLEQEEEV